MLTERTDKWKRIPTYKKMNFTSFFKSISNFQFPYTIDEETVLLETPLWQVYNGTRKSDSLPVTLFKAQRRADTEQLIANALHKAKILKIPGLCSVLEISDSDPQSTFIITERVTPFNWDKLKDYSRNKDSVYLWVSQLVETLQYMKTFVLGTLNRQSLFFNSKGQLVFFGLELCSNIEDSFHFGSQMKLYYSICGLQPPATEDPKIVDAVLLGSLLKNDLMKYTGMPKDWVKLVSSISNGKSSIARFADQIQTTESWYGNPMIELYSELKEWHIKNLQDKMIVLNNLEALYFEDPAMFKNLAPGFIENLILPELIDMIQNLVNNNGGAVPSTSHNKIVSFLAILLELATDSKSYDEPFRNIVGLCFKLPDRQVRFLLLMYLPTLVEPFGPAEVCNRIYPQFVQGLSDTEPKLRLETLKKIPYIVPSLNERQLNNELLRYLAKTQVDSDIEIRTWTVFIITKIASELSSSMGNRASILATAFTKSLKDPEIKPRLAALHGLTETITLFDAGTIATKVLSVIAPSFMDKDKLVRRKARELFKLYMARLEEAAKELDGSGEGADSTGTRIDFAEYESTRDQDAEMLAQFLDNLKLGSTSSVNLMKARSNNNSNISLGSTPAAPATPATPAAPVPTSTSTGDDAWEEKRRPVQRKSILSAKPKPQPKPTARKQAKKVELWDDPDVEDEGWGDDW